MKQFILTIIFLFSLSAYAQNVTPYVAAGLSVGNAGESTFAVTSYPSAEIGIMKDNLAFAAVVGRNNLAQNADTGFANNFWCEAKTAFYFPIKGVEGYGLFGIGTYLNGGVFVEYGGGISVGVSDNTCVFVQASSWDGVGYVTFGPSFSF
jgi:hypothetical protein